MARYTLFSKSLCFGFCLIVLSIPVFSKTINSITRSCRNYSFSTDTLLDKKIQIFPVTNNYNHKTVLTFTLANPTKLSIRIFDMDGREVAYLFERDVPAGNFEILLETRNLKKGVYYCNFFTGEKISMKKMITVK